MRPIIRALGGVAHRVAQCEARRRSLSERREPEASAPARIDWHPCPELAEVECGTLRLPIDWANPRGDGFDLAVARRKATDPSKRIGVLVINPGDPGGSGVNRRAGADGRLGGRAAAVRHHRLRPAWRGTQPARAVLDRGAGQATVALPDQPAGVRRPRRVQPRAGRRLPRAQRPDLRPRRHGRGGQGRRRAAQGPRRAQDQLLRRVLRHAHRPAVRRGVRAEHPRHGDRLQHGPQPRHVAVQRDRGRTPRTRSASS